VLSLEKLTRLDVAAGRAVAGAGHAPAAAETVAGWRPPLRLFLFGCDE